MLSMGEDSRTVCAYSQLAQRQQNFQQLLLSSSDLDVMREYSVLLEKRIEAEKKRVECELPSYRRGRGGNNIAENLKKSLLSVFKRKLPSAELAALEADCLRRHRLKSQKENVLVFFLYLHRLHLEGRIRYALIEDIREELRAKIRKYISNSLEKMQLEEGRREFHTKNIIEFQRFLQIDLDFRAPRSFAEVARQMHGFYLRKQAEFAKAVQRLARVVQSEPLLSSLFPDVPAPQPRLVVKEE